MSMQFFDAPSIEAATPYPELINAIGEAFREGGASPGRHIHSIPQADAEDGTLLIMPSWGNGGFFGVKLATVNPRNAEQGVPTVNGTYVLFDTATATPVATFDAASLTARRTAAASALAASKLAREGAKTLLMVGTGKLAPHLIEAHCAVRDYDRVLVWGRSSTKARAVVERLALDTDVQVVTDLAEASREADVISAATMSREALVHGADLQPGVHVDLVGAFTPAMRETDAEVFRRADQVWVDTNEGAEAEAGDILAAIEDGAFQSERIKGDLFALVARAPSRGKRDITIFKSVGTGLEDLAAAMLCVAQRPIQG